MRIRRQLYLTLVILTVSLGIFSQENAVEPEEEQTARAMPEDRKAASYTIYSMLMPLGETAGKNWPHKLWLVQDITVSVNGWPRSFPVLRIV
jgi:hypothetical protein